MISEVKEEKDGVPGGWKHGSNGTHPAETAGWIQETLPQFGCIIGMLGQRGNFCFRSSKDRVI